MFNEKSAVVQAWVRQIQREESEVTLKDVPNLSNLRNVVSGILNTNEMGEK